MSRTLHESTFDYLKPRPGQLEVMTAVREATKRYADILDQALDPGPDKTYALRKLREVNMWAMVALTRNSDGSPRDETS